MRRYGGPNGYGHIPDPEHHARGGVGLLFEKAGIDAAEAPDQASNRESGPGVWDQKPTSSCTGHAVCGATFTTLKQAGTPLSVPGSPKGVYAIGRALDRQRLPNGELPALDDVGAQPSQVMRGITEFGMPRLRPPPGTIYMPGTAAWGDADPATINENPNLGGLEDAGECVLEGEYAMNPADPMFLPHVRAVLAAGICICFCIFVDTVGARSVERWDPATGPLGAPAADPNGGLHYVYADGYRTDPATGRMIVAWVNSWGRGWGRGGYGEGDERFLAGWSNVVVMQVRRRST